MAIENAKKLIEKLAADAELKAAFEKDAKAALEAGDYGCTLAELKEAIALGKELDEDELTAVSGGGCDNPFGGSPGPGGCKLNYFKKECAATVEEGSWCGTNDWCDQWDERYTDRIAYSGCSGSEIG